jgi:type III secretory pathway component EscV
MVIDNNNREMARNLCKEYGIELPEIVTELTSNKVEKEEKV